MPTADLCTEEDVHQLVHGFYADVRRDPVLGPVFDAHITDWDRHLATMVDFWSSALRGTARFRGAPMPKHAALPGLSAELFQRWLTLFGETTARLGNQEMASRARALAVRIAESLWYGYQVNQAREQQGAA
ncbi:group III truncated hemoglobin [Ramlibacter sp. USB13]|uniref:Group III truncated hemoglobin n=1 Tax=Ramlibacter cellulosilyticus TaxID=2764187 RepID=A0A923MRW6_9BURK|nr:group III truncated hemoglobin [Ramlibacter cellulosilyticus]MBC5784697.1 group III truncated hemoglobin [Ramlibacter cellulosilyticus]